LIHPRYGLSKSGRAAPESALELNPYAKMKKYCAIFPNTSAPGKESKFGINNLNTGLSPSTATPSTDRLMAQYPYHRLQSE